MRIELKPQIEAVLAAQVAAGHFASIEDAITAAVLGLPLDESKIGSLAWARPLLDEADGAHRGTRTPNPRNRNPMLYPIELGTLC